MLRFSDIVFGPIHSRRLGASLGVNLLPGSGKVCNFDCIYCECGWNRDGRTADRFPSVADVGAALENTVSRAAADGVRIDSITFSGNGEPTLHPDFPEIIDITLAVRDRYYPDAAVSVLSNATRADIPEICAALKKVDNPILKIDAPTASLASKINHPFPGYDPVAVAKVLESFDGDFILQTMFLRSLDFSSCSEEFAEAWRKMVLRLHPRLVMVYSLDRPAPEQSLEKFSYREMEAVVKPLLDKGLNVKIY